MGEKDLTEKILADCNDVFADIVNVLLFDGEERLAENELEECGVHSMYRGIDNKLHEQERDVAKLWKKNGINIALIGFEHQTRPEKRMPLRIFGYEGASYREQLGNRKIYPVVTMVLYFGTDHWKYSKKLLDIVDAPNTLKPYVNDCKVNVFEIAWLPEETLKKFKSDFGIVARFMVEKRKNPNYLLYGKKHIKYADRILKLLTAITGDKRYEELLEYAEKGEIKTMCDVAERLVQKGKQEGIQEGKLLGQFKACRELINSGAVTAAKVAQTYGISVEELTSKMKELGV